jgi:hypothetical protein
VFAQGCSPYSCEWEADFLTDVTEPDPDDGSSFWNLMNSSAGGPIPTPAPAATAPAATAPVTPPVVAPTTVVATPTAAAVVATPTAPISITGAYNPDGTYDFGDNSTDVSGRLGSRAFGS